MSPAAVPRSEPIARACDAALAGVFATLAYTTVMTVLGKLHEKRVVRRARS